MRPPDRVALDGGVHLRQLRADDAEAIAGAVRESLEHLRPWMPWADERSGTPAFQAERLRRVVAAAADGEEWQYGLFDDEQRLLGSFGLTTRPGPGAVEIGYWVHVDATGRGHATRAARGLTDVGLGLDGIRRVLICCDQANVRSAAIPRRLGYRLAHVQTRAPEAPAESGRLMVWTRERPGARP